jgi:uncharacterized protein (TIGR02118 family)
MYRLITVYPRRSDSNFDWDHYRNVHEPMVSAALKTIFPNVTVRLGRPLPGHGDDAYHCIGMVDLATLDDVQRIVDFLSSDAFAPIAADIANYTNAEASFAILEL